MNIFDFSLFFYPVIATFGLSGTAAAILGSGVLSAGASLYGANKAAKAAKGVQPVNVAQLAADARANAETNLRRSLELEQQYLPGQAAARSGLQQTLAGLFGGDAQRARATALSGMQDLAQRGGVGELERTAADQILADLQLGGKLDAETQAGVIRGALSGAGGAGILGSQAGRGLTARDLGLTSLQLQNARRQAALQAGGQMTQSEMASLMGLQNMVGGQTSEALTASQVLSGMLPEAGLSAGDLASVAVGNVNQKNEARLAASQASTAGTQGALGALSQGLGMYAGLAALRPPVPPQTGQ
jgi:hypothetical protein